MHVLFRNLCIFFTISLTAACSCLDLIYKSFCKNRADSSLMENLIIQMSAEPRHHHATINLILFSWVYIACMSQ